jgi:single-strand DNA-binding protein
MINNRCSFQGNIGRIEVRDGNKGTFVTLSLAVSVKRSEEYETMWLNCIAFGLVADRIKTWSKGSKIWVEGRLDENKYVDKDGAEKKSFQLIINYADKLKDPNNEVIDSTLSDDVPF